MGWFAEWLLSGFALWLAFVGWIDSFQAQGSLRSTWLPSLLLLLLSP